MYIKKFLVVFCSLLFFVGCNKETLKDKIGEVPEKITWEDYFKYCSSGNLYREENFKKLKEKEVVWEGVVADIKDAPDLKELRGGFHTQTLLIKMEPSDAIFADLELRIKKELATEAKIFKKDDGIKFKGNLQFLGSGISANIINVTAIKRSAKKVDKTKKRTNPFK